MASTIKILSNLPSAIQHGRLVLEPGMNDVDCALWGLVLERSAFVHAAVKDGRLVVDPPPVLTLVPALAPEVDFEMIGDEPPVENHPRPRGGRKEK